MSNELSESKVMQALDWAYDKAINGVSGLDSASELADSYMKTNSSPVDMANSLIRWQNTKAGTSGNFFIWLGRHYNYAGFTIPANIASVMYVQIRMIAAIAHIGGHDIKDDRVKTLVYACLTGNAAKDIIKDAGIVIGTKLTTNAIKNISGKTLIEINKKVGFRLFTKFGYSTTFLTDLGKALPLVG